MTNLKNLSFTQNFLLRIFRLLQTYIKRHKEIIILLLLTLGFFHKIFLNYNQMLDSSDIIAMYSFWRSFLVESVFKFHQIPLWNPYIFSGMPFVGDSQSGIFYPFSLLFYIIPVNLAFGYGFLLDIFLIGVFTYTYSRIIGLTTFSSLVSSLCIMFNGTVILRIYPGHLSILDSIVWFPLLLVFYELTIKRNSILYAVFSSIPLTMILFSGHIQPGIYSVISSVIYFYIRYVYESGLNKRLLVAPLISITLALSLSAIHILPLLELAHTSQRTNGLAYNFASDFSLPPKQLVSFILPHFFGSPLNQTYWGRGNFEGLAVYSGIFPLILASIALLWSKNKYTIIFTILAIFSLLFSFGKYGFVFPFFFDYVLGFNVFRVPSRFLFVFGFSLSILAGFGSNILFSNLTVIQKKIKRLSKLLAVTAFFGIFICVLFYTFRNKLSLYESFILHNSYAVGINHFILLNMFRKDVAVLFFFLLLSALILHLSINGKNSIIRWAAVILIVGDLWIYSLPFYTTKDPSLVFKTPEIVRKIKEDTKQFRVFDISGQFITPLNKEKIESVTGINSTALSYYRGYLWLAGDHLENKDENFLDFYNIKNFTVLKLLNTKYIISQNEIRDKRLKKVYKDTFFLYQINDTLPRAFVVPNLKVLTSQKKILAELAKDTFDPKVTVILDKDPKISNSTTQEFKPVDVKEYEPNRIILQTEVSSDTILFLSEVWYPGWKAYDNGYKTEIFKANYIFRSIYLKKGSHKIIFIYYPISYKIGKTISIISLFLFILYIVYNFKIGQRKNKVSSRFKIILFSI